MIRENVIDAPVAANPAPTKTARRILGPWALSDARLAGARALYGKPANHGGTHKLGRSKMSYLKSRKMS